VGLAAVAWAALRRTTRMSFTVAVLVSILAAPALYHHYLAILVLFGAMALEHLGLGTRVVLVAFGILFGGVVLALALAFGLAGRDLAREALRGLARQAGGRQDDGINHL
jgi:hypothetical protein